MADQTEYLARAMQKIATLEAKVKEMREALEKIDKSTISHVDGRDLLDELHPRKELNILRRIDGKEWWYEGDWLSNLRDARNASRAALDKLKSAQEQPK